MGVHKGVSYGFNQCQYKGNQQGNLKNTYWWYMKEKGMAVGNMTQPLVGVGISKKYTISSVRCKISLQSV